MSNRRTSPYFLRIPSATPDATLTDMIDSLRSIRAVTDSHTRPGVAVIGFRATDDTDAVTLASTVAGIVQAEGWDVWTGYGVHKRTVA